MRYRIQFTAGKNEDFRWEVNEVAESSDLLQLIFSFQIMIAKEFKRIIEESHRIAGDDDIPF